MAQQHYNLPTSQDEDDPSSQRQQQSQQPQPLTTWIIQPPTQRYNPPRIYEYEPRHGQEMDSLHMSLQMDNTECLPRLKIAFGSCIMPTQSYLDPGSNLIHLTCTVPSWSLTQSGDKSITLYVIVVADQPHNILDAWPVGYFTYQSRKRSSAELMLDYNMMMKRTKPSATAAAAGGGAASSSTDDSTGGRDTQAQQQQQPSASSYMLPAQQGYDYNYYGLPPQYIQSTSTPTNNPTIPTSRTSRQYYDDSTSPSQLMFPYRPTASTDSFNYATNDPMGLSSGNMSAMAGLTDPSTSFATPTTPASLQPPPQQQQQQPIALSSGATVPHMQPRHPSISASSTGLDIAPAAAPSTLPRHDLAAGPTAAPSRTAATSATANPFANLLSHADLVIEGDMDAMMQDWTDQEKEDHRRLVRFWRRQHDHEIICHCQAIEPTNRVNTPQEIIVSCIYWQEKDDYFITSVDIIYLLEALIGVRFTTEEKNRVRRNLEGFRPLTVSKMKPDSGDFFRLIMAFHHPKPRNIEKDLKVFAWSSLPTALKKIISKYSASYSSTASVTLDAYSTPSTTS